HLIFDYQVTQSDFQNAIREYHKIVSAYEGYENVTNGALFKEIFPRKYMLYPHLLDQKLLKQTKLRDVKKFLKESIATSRTHITFVGDFSSKSLKRKLKKSFKKFFNKNSQYKMDLAVLPHYLSKEIKGLNVHRKSKDDKYHIYKASVFRREDLSTRETAALFISILNFLINQTDRKIEGFEDVDVSVYFQEIGGVMVLVFHLQGPKEQAKEIKGLLEKQTDKITKNVDSKVLKKLKTFFTFEKNVKILNIKMKAQNLNILHQTGVNLNFENELLQEAGKLKPSDVDKIFKAKFTGEMVLQING
ncbi:hypothetical protein MJH12_16235, partial [bacterium]|nr:hypothetical protein [bacterium]